MTDNALIHAQDGSNIRDSLKATKIEQYVRQCCAQFFHSHGLTKTTLGDIADIE